MNTFKVCYVSSEVAPFVRTKALDGLAKMSWALPVALKEMEQDVRLMMPKYKAINERKYVLREVIRLREVNINLGNGDKAANGKTAFLPNSKVHVYFLSVPEYFDRKGYYQDPQTGENYPDNAERFAYFCKSVLETLKLLYWQPDVIHCSDWPTALIPFYLRTHYREDEFFDQTRTVLTVHNLAEQGRFPLADAEKIGIAPELIQPGGALELDGQLNFLKAGLQYADTISLTSEHFAAYVLNHPEAAHGLGEILKQRKSDIYAISNGADYQVWNPEEDSQMATPYDAKTLEKRVENKARLLEEYLLAQNPLLPLLGVLCDFNDPEAMSLVEEVIPALMEKEVLAVVVNTGDYKTNSVLKKLSGANSRRLLVKERLDKRLTHLLMGGGDVIFIPTETSRGDDFHLVSLRYGAVPVVPASGVFADSISEFNSETGKGNGFTFAKANSREALAVIDRALKLHKNARIWTKLQKNGMKEDFSWENTAKKYLKLYEKALKKR